MAHCEPFSMTKGLEAKWLSRASGVDGTARPCKSQQVRPDGDGTVSVAGLRTPRTCSLSHAVGPLDHPSASETKKPLVPSA
jgi:hypothetical protein